MAAAGSSTRRPGGVIFDLDGTLVDSLADIAAAMNRTLRPPGASRSTRSTRYRTFIGEGVRKLVERALPPGTEDVREALRRRLPGGLRRKPPERDAPYPGIPEVLDALQSREASPWRC